MTLDYNANLSVNLDTLDRTYQRLVRQRTAEPVFGRTLDHDDASVCLPEGDDWSTPQKPALMTQWSRTLRTTLPFMACDLVSLVLASLLGQGALHLVHYTPLSPLAQAMPLALCPLLIAYWFGGLYSEIWVHPVIEFRELTHVTSLACLAATITALALSPWLAIWCATAWLGAVVFVPLLRTLARQWLAGRTWWGYPTVLIGTGAGAVRMVNMLLDVPRSGLRPILVSDPLKACRTSLLPVVNDPPTLESLIRAQGIRHAVVSLPDLSMSRMSEILDHFSGLVPHVLVLSDASTLPTLWGTSRSGGRLSGIEVRNGLLMATLQFLKRALDLSLALVVIAASSWLMILLAVLVKLTSRGPVFYGQKRIGQHGRSFTAWKFRTMHPNADAMLREYLHKVAEARVEWERDQKLRRDPRVTTLGRILRATSLDELPQIWNILRGEISLVGPRPIVESEVKRYGGVFALYTKVKPGITGLWQVSGRSNLSYEDRVRLDQFYIRHWSPWLDVYILARTVLVLLSREGAY